MKRKQFLQKITTTKKAKTTTKSGEKKILRNPSRQIPKWEILEKKKKSKIFLEKNKCAQRKKRKKKKRNAINKQKTRHRISAVYSN